jgi:hypothetical protein
MVETRVARDALRYASLRARRSVVSCKSGRPRRITSTLLLSLRRALSAWTRRSSSAGSVTLDLVLDYWKVMESGETFAGAPVTVLSRR